MQIAPGRHEAAARAIIAKMAELDAAISAADHRHRFASGMEEMWPQQATRGPSTQILANMEG